MAEGQNEAQETAHSHEPERGDIWEHIASGGVYGIVGRATNKEPDGPIDGLVVYRAIGQGGYYVRTLEGFLARFRRCRTMREVARDLKAEGG